MKMKYLVMLIIFLVTVNVTDILFTNNCIIGSSCYVTPNEAASIVGTMCL